MCILQTERPAGGITSCTLTVFPNFTLVILWRFSRRFNHSSILLTSYLICPLTERPAGGITSYTLTVFPNFTLVILWRFSRRFNHSSILLTSYLICPLTERPAGGITSYTLTVLSEFYFDCSMRFLSLISLSIDQLCRTFCYDFAKLHPQAVCCCQSRFGMLSFWNFNLWSEHAYFPLFY